MLALVCPRSYKLTHFQPIYSISTIDLPKPAQISMIDGLDGPLNSAVVLGEVGVVGKVWGQ